MSGDYHLPPYRWLQFGNMRTPSARGRSAGQRPPVPPALPQAPCAPTALASLGVLQCTAGPHRTHGGPSRPNRPWRAHLPDGPRGASSVSGGRRRSSVTSSGDQSQDQSRPEKQVGVCRHPWADDLAPHPMCPRDPKGEGAWLPWSTTVLVDRPLLQGLGATAIATALGIGRASGHRVLKLAA